MSNIISVQGLDVGIVAIARSSLVEGASKVGDLINGYAIALCSVFDVRDTNGQLVSKWYDLSGKDAKGIKAERNEFNKAMIARGYTSGVDKDGNPKASATVNTYWQRVKEASGYVPKGRVTGGTDVDSKTATELKTIINRILKAQEDGQVNHADEIVDSLKESFEILTGESFNAGK